MQRALVVGVLFHHAAAGAGAAPRDESHPRTARQAGCTQETRPIITSVTPTHASVGTVITLRGSWMPYTDTLQAACTWRSSRDAFAFSGPEYSYQGGRIEGGVGIMCKVPDFPPELAQERADLSKQGEGVSIYVSVSVWEPTVESSGHTSNANCNTDFRDPVTNNDAGTSP
jgi:hypothetical protein